MVDINYFKKKIIDEFDRESLSKFNDGATGLETVYTIDDKNYYISYHRTLDRETYSWITYYYIAETVFNNRICIDNEVKEIYDFISNENSIQRKIHLQLKGDVNISGKYYAEMARSLYVKYGGNITEQNINEEIIIYMLKN